MDDEETSGAAQNDEKFLKLLDFSFTRGGRMSAGKHDNSINSKDKLLPGTTYYRRVARRTGL